VARDLPDAEACAQHRLRMSRGCPRRGWCTKWSAITSKPSARRPPVCATGKGCPGSSNRSFANSCAAGAWPFDQAQGHPERSRGMAGGFARFHCDDCGLDRFVPFACKARAICASCGPSTLLRAVPSTVEGRRATDGGTRRALSGRRVPGGACATVGPDVPASASVPAGVGSRVVPRGGPSTMLRAILSRVEGWPFDDAQGHPEQGRRMALRRCSGPS
jgi:ribosomal protein S27E